MNHAAPPRGERELVVAMNAAEQTRRMLQWWRCRGIDTVDLAIRSADGQMMWRRATKLTGGELSWARASNAKGADIYVRPSRGKHWPILFLDDVARTMALRIIRKYDALAIHTSPQGGCHIWLACTRSLSEKQRTIHQRRLAKLIGADPASVSGEHLGRLAGFKNYKRGGVWVNVIANDLSKPRWNPPATPILQHKTNPSGKILLPRSRGGNDGSASGREWGWVCGALEAGISPQKVYTRLLHTAAARRGADAQRYARHTVNKALQGRLKKKSIQPLDKA